MSDSDEQQMSDHDICNDCLRKQEEEQGEQEPEEHEFETETCSSQCAHSQPQITIKIGSVIVIEDKAKNGKPKKVEDETKEVKSKRLCRFFNTPNGCNKGDECHFKHEVVECANPECNPKRCMFHHPVDHQHSVDHSNEGRYFKAGGKKTRQRVNPY